mgnify:CR=1 FL=1|tara:strand:+ start:439 stop:642 length:204 start_codon:yes stop_codon:yes gene_type:complete
MILNQKLNHKEQFTAALTLACIAPTEEQSHLALDLAEQLAPNLSQDEREDCMKGIEFAFNLRKIFGE